MKSESLAVAFPSYFAAGPCPESVGGAATAECATGTELGSSASGGSVGVVTCQPRRVIGTHSL